jgi:hypothetical protein
MFIRVSINQNSIDFVSHSIMFINLVVIWQAYPQEKVGVFVQRGKGGPLTVVEYSELDPSLASTVNQATGRLRFCWSNVSLFFFIISCLLLSKLTFVWDLRIISLEFRHDLIKWKDRGWRVCALQFITGALVLSYIIH